MMEPRAAVLGLAGPEITAAELALFQRYRPAGAILFARNVRNPAQLRALTAAIREVLGDAAPILIDQEGGRAARLRPPHWPGFPPAGVFEGRPYDAAANAALLGRECVAVGADVVCAPVLDLRWPGAHGVIGDRAFSADPAEVARLGAAWIAGLRAAGCVPVIKHVPGHGRAAADSHESLPRVSVGRDDLAIDWEPFRAICADNHGRGLWAMTAHVAFDAIDPHRPATLSPRTVREVIRGAIGFDGPLVTDDLGMGALRGPPGELAAEAIAAGCDLALHCSGRIEDNEAVLRAVPPVSVVTARRMAEARDAARGVSAAAVARAPGLDPTRDAA